MWEQFRGNDFSVMTGSDNGQGRANNNDKTSNLDNSELIIKDEDPLEIM